MSTQTQTEQISFWQAPGLFAEDVTRVRDFSMPVRHFHESVELYFLLEGERYYFIEQDTWHVKAGMAVLIASNQIHKTSLVPGCSVHRRFLLQLSPALAGRLCALADIREIEALSGAVAFSADSWTMARHIIGQMEKELASPTAESSPMLDSYALQLLLLFARSRREEAGLPAARSADAVRSDSGVHRTVHEIVLYLQAHCCEPCRLDSLAARFYISTPYLTRIFKSVTGFTVVEYLTVCRLRRARRLLLDTTLPVTEVAARSGFGNLNYFEKMFKRFTNQTPLKFRQSGSSGNGKAEDFPHP
ncbi:MAG: AraC family transcriptional regulator [Eubacteriales bacterium]|nr:AraC family transcriptional regulator [Eubacteriales bacterium]